MSSLSTVPVILLGVGNVGRTFVHQVLKNRTWHAEKFNLKFEFLALFDSSGCVSDAKSLSDEVVEEAVAWKAGGKRLKDFNNGVSSDVVTDATGIIKACSKSLVVDCSATSCTLSVLQYAIANGHGIVLANKKPVTDTQASFNQLYSADTLDRCGFESTVGAGTPFVASVLRLLAANDQVKKIEGTFSGTLGYLMTGLEEGNSYSKTVNTAFELGYTEPNPRDDLGGVDVARKALILARLLGWELEMDQVSIESLYPDSLESLPVAEFLQNIADIDDDYEKKLANAKSEGKVLRYVATIEDGTCVVGLKALAKESPIGRLTGTSNMMAVYTDIYGEKPLVVQGSGAGAEITASGVLTDCVNVARNMY